MVLIGTPHHPYRQDGVATQSYQQRWAEGTFLPREWSPESGEIVVMGPSRGAMVLSGGTKAPPAMGLAGRALRQKPQFISLLTLQCPASFSPRPIPKES